MSIHSVRLKVLVFGDMTPNVSSWGKRMVFGVHCLYYFIIIANDWIIFTWRKVCKERVKMVSIHHRI